VGRHCWGRNNAAALPGGVQTRQGQNFPEVLKTIVSEVCFLLRPEDRKGSMRRAVLPMSQRLASHIRMELPQCLALETVNDLAAS